MKNNNYNSNELAENIKLWGEKLGFSAIGITGPDVSEYQSRLQQHLKNGFHADMEYLTRRLDSRELFPETRTIIVCAMNYLPKCNPKTHISRYALGRDYHKVMRKRLNMLAKKIGNHNYRCCVDTSPILEKALAVKAGLGWQGKNSLILNQQGSWYFLGEILTDLDLPLDQPIENHCGTCTKCVDACPTKALAKPYQLDARRCIAYLTIEHKEDIPAELHQLIGTHVYGCDECQLACPWNSFAKPTKEPDFRPRHNLDKATLTELANWTEAEFLQKTEGSAIHRIGYERWRRNIVATIKNKPMHTKIITK